MDKFHPTLIYILLFLATLFYYLFSKKHNKRHKLIAKLPPGSMGWPYIGETLQLYCKDPNIFFSDKQTRYGEIFKTHILGCPCVMLASPEASRFVLVTNADLFKPTYPKSKEKMIGPNALFFHQGEYHTQLRKLVVTSLSPESIKKFIHGIESIAISTLDSWPNGYIINTFQQMKKFSFEVGILAIFGELGKQHKEELKNNYCIVDKGYNSFPTNLPGTAYHKALTARRRLSRILEEIISERKEKKLSEKDLLGHLLNFKNDKGETLSDDQISDNIIGILFAAQDTTASALTWIIKYLHDHPKLLQAIKAEQKAIYLSNEKGNKSLTWTQTRSNMPLTYKVILESLRMASIVSFTFREAVVDVVYKGYLIPKGWKVMPLFRNIHHNPEFFNEPQNFDPNRFEVAPKPNTFLPFGTGAHSCPGNELAKLEILILIHHLVNKLRWELVGSQDMVEYSPFPVPYNGLPARIWREPDTQEIYHQKKLPK
ncbi:cytochrome P450 [Perilla frutescens var. hirtella]|uniref:(+)-abscisic acid 8'-hydroxylase n=1 Tax=Perilla frutescens var. hirtella TaxID=608512 RepID=A0AAD4P3X9_PERFH|nr:cytochrome P450 [Perilla frutescens var. hirtella]